ncbi:hypothetical protein ACIOWG_26220 [Streptomyces sp. NPDC087658]|uniref:hypothetical protein n=1 Tax=Streptomyces sp. NPDC087658 TaxID=3365800 RepID=UPI00380D67BC
MSSVRGAHPTLPAGLLTAARLIRLAGRLGHPRPDPVDTPGAGSAIADRFAAMAAARVPVTTLLIGEGGSGGALALSAPGNMGATPDSYFSVIVSELATDLLRRPASETRAPADPAAAPAGSGGVRCRTGNGRGAGSRILRSLSPAFQTRCLG